MKPISKIKINNFLLIDFVKINHNINEYYLENGDKINNSKNIFSVEILDNITNKWRAFSLSSSNKWKTYIFTEYISRSRSMKGKNTWSKGRVPPNKGITNKGFFGEEKAKEISKKISQKSKEFFKDDKYFESREKRSKKLSLLLKGKPKNRTEEGKKSFREKRKGITISDELKQKISESVKKTYQNNPIYRKSVANKKEKNGMFGKTHSFEIRKKISQKVKKAYKENLKYRLSLRKCGAISQLSQNRKKSKPEIIVEEKLKEHNIKFQYQYILCFYAYDFFIPSLNCFIEVQGDYWHGNPLFYKKDNLLEHQKKKKIRDRQKKTFAENRGFKVYQIWENNIKQNNFSEIKEILNAEKI